MIGSSMHDPMKFIRNFSIIAHIDHGKSTLSDRLLEITQTVSARDMREQILDKMDLEQEKGITIKSHPVTMRYRTPSGECYTINFIDTPGHVDFSYEVSRSLAACEGALLIIDAVQGVQAQTLANLYLALEKNLEILCVINKIDLPSARVEEVKQEIEEIIGLDTSKAILCSAKMGIGIQDILNAIIEEIPPPKDLNSPFLQALIFDSHYDTYRGVMVYLRVLSGEIYPGLRIRLLATDKSFEVAECGIFSPNETPVDRLRSGEVGYVLANIKTVSDVRIGDTITTEKGGTNEPLPGFKKIQPVVFAAIYPVDTSQYELLKDALKKLQLNDSALHIEQESSQVLGLGFRCGFLGLLHLEILFERLRREFHLDIITTAPSVLYKVHLSDGSIVEVDNPAHYPDPGRIRSVEEPWVLSHIMTPAHYLGAIMSLGMEKRGYLQKTETAGKDRLLLSYRFPLNEIVTDFNDRLKSITQGYASFDYEPEGYEIGDIIKLEIRINEEIIDAFSMLVHRSMADRRGRALCARLKDSIPRHLFKIPIQAAIGGTIIARETISALAKNVTAKCYGGDITRKRKLLEKQKEGKAKMKQFGSVHIPQETFIDVLKSDPNES